MAANLFWVGVLLAQLGRATVDRQLGLEVADSFAQRRELGVLRGRHARLDPGVDARLASPRIDRLAADPQLRSHPSHRPARLDQIDHTPPDIPSVP